MTKKIVTQCSVEGCLKIAKTKILCGMHYARWRRHGTTDKLTYRKPRQIDWVCKIEGCETIRRKGMRYCQKHDWRMKKYGNPDTSIHNIGEGKTYEQRFWSRVNLTADIERCWEWQGLVDGVMGYGKTQLTVNGQKLRTAHRVAYYLATRQMPTQMILHSCDNPKCVNPQHLREGTALDNKQDAVSRGRHARGEKVNTSKLTKSTVVDIRNRCDQGESPSAIAKELGMNPSTIFRIKSRQYWGHI